MRVHHDDAQRVNELLIERSGRAPTTEEVKPSHVSMVSYPNAVTKLVEAAAGLQRDASRRMGHVTTSQDKEAANAGVN